MVVTTLPIVKIVTVYLNPSHKETSMATDTVQVRVPSEFRLELATLSEACNSTQSETIRDMIEKAMPKWREWATAEAAKLANLPHGVTDRQVDKAAEELAREFNASQRLVLTGRNLFSPRSKAIYRLLTAIWGEENTKTSTLSAFLDAMKETAEQAPEPPPGPTPTVRGFKKKSPQ